MRTISLLACSVVALLLSGCSKPEVIPPTPEAIQAFIGSAFDGDTAAIRTAIDAGMPVNQQGEDKTCALMAASFNGHVAAMTALIEAGADVNQRCNMDVTPLMAACGPFPEAVRLLIESGAEVNATDGNENFTALMYAATEGLSPIVDILLAAGADPAMVDVDDDTAGNFARSRGFTALADKLDALVNEK